MNYYDARQKADKDGKPTGLWHYTLQNDDYIYPVGYCAQGCKGHATPEEAREHYRLYLLDDARYDGKLQHEQRECEMCGLWVQTYATIPLLCNEHLNRETLDVVMHRVGQMIAS